MGDLPLASLASQALVALTIEVDDEYEDRAPHVTTAGSGRRGAGPWLTSVAMHVNFLRFVTDDGVRMADLSAAAGYPTPVHPAYHGMRRWGYVRYVPDIAGSPRVTDGEARVVPTPAGTRARRIWDDVLDDTAVTWSGRGLDPLRAAVVDVVAGIDRPLPEHVPVLGPVFEAPVLDRPTSRPAAELGLLGLLSKVVAAATYEFEASSPLSLATCSALLRPLGPEPTPVRDLPAVSGLAKQVWGAAVGQLEKRGLAVAEAAARGRGKVVRLTPVGITACDGAVAQLRVIEHRWEDDGMALLPARRELDALVGDGTPEAPVFAGLGRHPDGWRARLPPRQVLPHAPMCLHRGGYPDGS